MTLLTTEMQVRWNGSTRKHYEERGYIWTKQNDWFTVPIEDAITTTPNRVEVECDYCSKTHSKPYRAYIKSREIVSKDCCSNRKCMYAKTEEVNMVKYGVKNINSLESHKEKLRKANQTPKEEIIRVANNKGLTILNIEDFQNEKSRLSVTCSNHPNLGIIDTNFADIRDKKHCCRMGGYESTAKAKKKNPSEIRKLFENSNLIPMFEDEDCIDSRTPLTYKCPHHLDKRRTVQSLYNSIHFRRMLLLCQRKNWIKINVQSG